MKKTLITLAALAAAFSGVASAEFTTVPVGGDFYAGSFTLTFYISDLDQVAATGTVLGSYYGDLGAASPDTNKFVLSKSGDAITLTVGRCSGDSGVGAMEFYGTDYVTFSATLTEGVVYTVSNVGANTSQSVTLSGEGITSETLSYNGNMNGKTSSMSTYFNGTFSVSNVPATPETPAVPEPTTATLSLLALAGLAARRRRK